MSRSGAIRCYCGLVHEHFHGSQFRHAGCSDPGKRTNRSVFLYGCVFKVLSVIIAMSIVVNGKTNWLEGLMLQLTYIIVAVVYW